MAVDWNSIGSYNGLGFWVFLAAEFENKKKGDNLSESTVN